MSAQPTDPRPPAPFPVYPVPPELLAYARQTFDAEEFWKDVRELQQTGGVPLEAFIAEIEAVVRGS